MKTRILTMLAMALMALTSCVHRGFDYDMKRMAYVEVVFDWRNAPDAQPESMTLYMYPQDGGQPERYDFSGRDGGIIRIPTGVYDAICINSDKRNVIYNDIEKFGTFEVTTPKLAVMAFDETMGVRSSDVPVAPGTEDQEIMEQPPMLWSSSEIGFNVTVQSTPRSKADIDIEVEHQVLTMYPKPIVDTYVVTVKNVRNANYLKSLSGTISDMSDGYLAGPQVDTDTEVILSFGLEHNLGEANAEGMFLTFGHCPGDRRSHKLLLYAILTDDSKYYYEFDVSDQAHNPPDENGIYHIVVEFIDIPDPSGGALSPDVNIWTGEDIYFEL